MKKTVDQLLKQTLTSDQEPDARLNQEILDRAREMIPNKEIITMEKKRFRIPAAVAAACMVLAVGSVSTAAVFHYLNPVEVAQEIEDDGLISAFSGDEAILVNESQEFGDYRITFLGCAAGSNLSKYNENTQLKVIKDIDENNSGEESVKVIDHLDNDRMCAVIAIERSDGMPMPDTGSEEYGEDSFFASFYIRGLKPWEYNAFSMSGGYSEFVKDGIQYRVLDMDNIEMFADRGIYLGVNDGTFYQQEAYQYDESTGDIACKEDYSGVNALFRVPVDPAKADSVAADAYLEQWEKDMYADEDDVDTVDKDEAAAEQEAEDWVAQAEKAMKEGRLSEYAARVESTVQTITPEEDKDWGSHADYSWETERGAKGTVAVFVDECFPDHKAGDMALIGYTISDNNLEDLELEVATLNEDGTVTCAIYRPVLK